jgi:tetratricopeptide (TPR) repeat protein
LSNDARAWRGIARTRRDRGEYAEALRVIDAALEALEPTATDVLPLKLETAQTLSVQGRFIDAIAAARAALGDAGDRRDPIVAQLLVRLARSEAVAGEGDAALRDAQEARTISAEHGDVLAELAAVRLIGDSYTRLGRLDDGVAAFREALRLAERIGAVAEAAGGLLNLGWAERRRGNLDEAITWDRRAAEQFDRIRHGSGRATAYGNLASHLVLRGNYDEALEQAERALEIAREIDHTYTIADVFQTIASARMGRGEFAEAAARAEESAALFQRMGARPQLAEALRLASEAWAKAGNEERARDLESRARSVLN